MNTGISTTSTGAGFRPSTVGMGFMFFLPVSRFWFLESTKIRSSWMWNAVDDSAWRCWREESRFSKDMSWHTPKINIDPEHGKGDGPFWKPAFSSSILIVRGVFFGVVAPFFCWIAMLPEGKWLRFVGKRHLYNTCGKDGIKPQKYLDRFVRHWKRAVTSTSFGEFHHDNTPCNCSPKRYSPVVGITLFIS